MEEKKAIEQQGKEATDEELTRKNVPAPAPRPGGWRLVKDPEQIKIEKDQQKQTLMEIEHYFYQKATEQFYEQRMTKVVEKATVFGKGGISTAEKESVNAPRPGPWAESFDDVMFWM